MTEQSDVLKVAENYELLARIVRLKKAGIKVERLLIDLEALIDKHLPENDALRSTTLNDLGVRHTEPLTRNQ